MIQKMRRNGWNGEKQLETAGNGRKRLKWAEKRTEKRNPILTEIQSSLTRLIPDRL